MSKKGRAAASSRVLTSKTTGAGERDLESEEARQAQADISRIEQDKAAAQEADKIGSVVDYGPHITDQSPTQVFGMALIDACKGDVKRIPAWRFKRWYFRDKIIIDFFSRQQEYDAAQVEARRKMAHQFKFKYAALGPGMSYRTDLPRQLGLRG